MEFEHYPLCGSYCVTVGHNLPMVRLMHPLLGKLKIVAKNRILFLICTYLHHLNFVSYHTMTGSWSPIYNATQSVDSFFVIGAVLLAYLSTDKIIAKFNSVSNFVRGYTLYLISRYVRLIPVILFTAWAIVSVLPPIPDGIFVGGVYTYGQRLCEAGQPGLWKAFFFLRSVSELSCSTPEGQMTFQMILI